MKNYYRLYNKYKSKYLKLQGGAMKKEDYDRNLKHNINVYFDKGSNNPWMEQEVPKKTINDRPITEVTQAEFENYLARLMDDRYYVRTADLSNLLTTETMEFSPIVNLRFTEDFYINLFKGTSYKRYLQIPEVSPDIDKRYRIFIEYQEKKGQLPEKKYYTFADDPNPCHLIKIIKDEFNRTQTAKLNENAFIDIKILEKDLQGRHHYFGITWNKPQRIRCKWWPN